MTELYSSSTYIISNPNSDLNKVHISSVSHVNPRNFEFPLSSVGEISSPCHFKCKETKNAVLE